MAATKSPVPNICIHHIVFDFEGGREGGREEGGGGEEKGRGGEGEGEGGKNKFEIFLFGFSNSI